MSLLFTGRERRGIVDAGCMYCCTSLVIWNLPRSEEIMRVCRMKTLNIIEKILCLQIQIHDIRPPALVKPFDVKASQADHEQRVHLLKVGMVVEAVLRGWCPDTNLRSVDPDCATFSAILDHSSFFFHGCQFQGLTPSLIG